VRDGLGWSPGRQHVEHREERAGGYRVESRTPAARNRLE
jgi:hypothetical protein